MTRDQLEQELQPILSAQVQTVRMITFALCGGVVMFFAVAIALGLTSTVAPTESTLETVRAMTYVCFALTAACWPSSFVMPAIARKQLPKSLDEGVAQACAVDRSARIIGLALREGPSLMGLVVVVIASTGGLLRSDHWVLVNALPGLAFVLHALATLTGPEDIRRELLAAVALE